MALEACLAGFCSTRVLQSSSKKRLRRTSAMSMDEVSHK